MTFDEKTSQQLVQVIEKNGYDDLMKLITPLNILDPENNLPYKIKLGDDEQPILAYLMYKCKNKLFSAILRTIFNRCKSEGINTAEVAAQLISKHNLYVHVKMCRKNSIIRNYKILVNKSLFDEKTKQQYIQDADDAINLNAENAVPNSAVSENIRDTEKPTHQEEVFYKKEYSDAITLNQEYTEQVTLMRRQVETLSQQNKIMCEDMNKLRHDYHEHLQTQTKLMEENAQLTEKNTRLKASISESEKKLNIALVSVGTQTEVASETVTESSIPVEKFDQFIQRPKVVQTPERSPFESENQQLKTRLDKIHNMIQACQKLCNAIDSSLEYLDKWYRFNNRKKVRAIRRAKQNAQQFFNGTPEDYSESEFLTYKQGTDLSIEEALGLKRYKLPFFSKNAIKETQSETRFRKALRT